MLKYILVGLSLTVLQQLLLVYLLCKVIRVRKTVLLVLTYGLIPPLLQVLNVYGPQGFQFWISIASTLFLLLIPLAFSKEKWQVTLTASSFYLCALLLSDLLSTALLTSFTNNMLAVLRTSIPLTVLMKLTVLLGELIFMFPTYFMLRKRLHKETFLKHAGLLILLPFTQCLLIASNAFVYAEEFPKNATLRMAGMVLLCIGVDLLFFRLLEKMQKSYALQEQAADMQYRSELQDTYFKQMETGLTAVNRLRHDLNNQLQTAYAIFAGGNHQQAMEQLRQMERALAQDALPLPQCENRLAAALLEDQTEKLAAQGISLACSAQIPASLPVHDGVLCAILAEFLQQAAASCAAAGATALTVEIAAEARLRLLAAHRAPAKRARQTDLARQAAFQTRYAAHMQTQVREGTCTIEATVPLEACQEPTADAGASG